MFETASLVGFFRMLLILALIYFGLRVLSRLLAPFILKYLANKVNSRFDGAFNAKKNDSTSAKEGETTIDKMPKQNKSSNNKVGEYVDFEEIKD